MAEAASGQYYDKLYLVNWSVNQPLSNRDFVSKTSFRGVRVGYRELINEKVAAGIDLNAYSYKGYEDRQTYVSNGGAITTDFFKYVTSYGATFVVEYYFLTESKIMPYAGLGIGAAHNKFDVFYNLYSTTQGSWGFLARPQVGAWMKLGQKSSWALHGSIQADIATTKSTDFDYHNFNTLGLQIGFVYTDW
jgi:hypothetical protein